jgi:hypothetical protein
MVKSVTEIEKKMQKYSVDSERHPQRRPPTTTIYKPADQEEARDFARKLKELGKDLRCTCSVGKEENIFFRGLMSYVSIKDVQPAAKELVISYRIPVISTG